MRFGRIPFFRSNSIGCASASTAAPRPNTEEHSEVRNLKVLRSRIVTVGVLGALLVSGSAAFAVSGPFAEMAGVWSGSGTIALIGMNAAQCGTNVAVCVITAFNSETPANANAGTQFLATTH